MKPILIDTEKFLGLVFNPGMPQPEQNKVDDRQQIIITPLILKELLTVSKVPGVILDKEHFFHHLFGPSDTRGTGTTPIQEIHVTRETFKEILDKYTGDK